MKRLVFLFGVISSIFLNNSVLAAPSESECASISQQYLNKTTALVSESKWSSSEIGNIWLLHQYFLKMSDSRVYNEVSMLETGGVKIVTRYYPNSCAILDSFYGNDGATIINKPIYSGQSMWQLFQQAERLVDNQEFDTPLAGLSNSNGFQIACSARAEDVGDPNKYQCKAL